MRRTIKAEIVEPRPRMKLERLVLPRSVLAALKSCTAGLDHQDFQVTLEMEDGSPVIIKWDGAEFYTMFNEKKHIVPCDTK